MQITVLKTKISHATITHTELLYEGSITIAEDLLEEANIRPGEQVHIVNANNGERLVTYAIKGERGSTVFGLNGPAARKGLIGDTIFILAYATIDEADSVDPIHINMKHRG